ncbi:MAG: hypothetical protein ACOCXH_04435 [Cyclobacteriaceae bacterium]
MIKYEVGEIFPGKLPSHEGGLIQTMANGSFDFTINIAEPKTKEVANAKKGRIELYLFIRDQIPFIIVDLKDVRIEIDAPYNFLKVPEPQRSEWLRAESNAVNLFMVDAMTKRLKSMRMLGMEPEFMEMYKDTCRGQLKAYSGPGSVDSVIIELMQKYTIPEMKKDAQISQFFKKVL